MSQKKYSRKGSAEKEHVVLDQHFMVDGADLRRIAEAAHIKAGERVLEIGAGTGNLTDILAGTGARVTAIEIDRRLAAGLRERFSSRKNVEVLEGNALKLLGSSGGRIGFDKLVSNIPYAICEPLLHLLRQCDFESAVLTVPEGFAGRITSDMTRTGAENGIFFSTEVLFRVPRQHFKPVPGTDSAVIRMRPSRSLLASALRSRRAKLKNALMEAVVEARACTKNQARESIKAMNLSSSVVEKRVADVDLNDLRQLITKFRNLGT